MLKSQYEPKYISSGSNIPKISLFENKRYKFLVGLHNGFTPLELQRELNWTNEELQSETAILKDNGYLKEFGKNDFVPSVSIVTLEEGNRMFKQSEKVALTIVAAINEIEPNIRKIFKKMEVSNSVEYEQFSFFLLSNVLLDNWQINNVENQFLKKKRTLRHGSRYYLQLREKNPLSKREAFGIYGNQYYCKDGICYVVYGNNRINNELAFEELVRLDIPSLTISDQNLLQSMSNLFSPRLIEILMENREYFLKIFNRSIYQKELTFEEYFIWFYHFLYTRATDILHLQGVIIIPESGIYRVRLDKH